MTSSVEQQSPIRLLIVEDNDAQRKILTDLMRDEGFDPVACSNATEALVRARDGLFGVAVLDQRLPEMSGTELLERLRTMQRGMRVIIHTAYGSFESAKDAVNLGAFAYVEKLGHPEELIREVHHASQVWMAEALQRSEEKYRHLVDSVQAIVWRADPVTNRFLFVSHEAENILGYPVRQWLSEAAFWKDHIHPEDRARIVARCAEAAAEQRPHEFEYRMMAADGRVVWLHDFVNVVIENGRATELVGVMVDITEQKRIAEALRASEESFRLMFAHNPVPMWVYDRETHAFLDVNVAALEKYGYDRDAFLSMKIEDIHPVEDIPRFREYLDTATETVRYMTQWRHRKEDGTLLDVAVTSHNFSYRERPGRLMLADDVTERKRLEKEILEISNREQRRVGQDLHDGLGQLLAGIGFRLAELEGDLQKAGLPVASEAAEIGQMVERAIAQTRALAHGLDPVNVEQQGLARALGALTRSIENIYGIPCVFDCPQPLSVHDPEVAIHVYRIAQEAMTNALKHAAASRIDVVMTQQHGRVMLRVSDDGVGLPETNPSHAGMGLRIMDYRARMIGGTFTVGSGPAAGSVVTCCFPYTFFQKPAD